MKLEVSTPGTTRRQFTDAFKSETVGSRGNRSGQWPSWLGTSGFSDNVLYRWRSEERHIASQGSTRKAKCTGPEN